MVRANDEEDEDEARCLYSVLDISSDGVLEMVATSSKLETRAPFFFCGSGRSIAHPISGTVTHSCQRPGQRRIVGRAFLFRCCTRRWTLQLDSRVHPGAGANDVPVQAGSLTCTGTGVKLRRCAWAGHVGTVRVHVTSLKQQVL